MTALSRSLPPAALDPERAESRRTSLKGNEANELDKMMRQSMQSVLHCYERRARDNAHLVSLVQTHQASLVRLQRENAELKREKQALHASRSALAARFTALKKTAMELEAFRRGIATMVETGGGRKTEASILQATNNIEDWMPVNEEEEDEKQLIIQTITNGPRDDENQEIAGFAEQRGDGVADDRTMHSVELRQSASFELDQPSRRRESFSLGPATHRVSDRNTGSLGLARRNSSGPTTTDRVARSISGPDLRQVVPAKIHPAARTFSTSLGPVGTHSKQQPQREPYCVSSPTHKRTTSTNASTTPTPDSVGRRSQPQQQQQSGSRGIDAAALYREIRKHLAPADFEAFASSVAAFNAGTQSSEATVERVAGIVKDRRLATCMSELIYSAIEEAKTGGTTDKNIVGSRITKSADDTK